MFTRPFMLFRRSFSNNANNNYIPPSCYEIKDIKYDIIISELDKIKIMQNINYCLLLINTLITVIF